MLFQHASIWHWCSELLLRLPSQGVHGLFPTRQLQRGRVRLQRRCQQPCDFPVAQPRMRNAVVHLLLRRQWRAAHLLQACPSAHTTPGRITQLPRTRTRNPAL